MKENIQHGGFIYSKEHLQPVHEFHLEVTFLVTWTSLEQQSETRARQQEVSEDIESALQSSAQLQNKNLSHYPFIEDANADAPSVLCQFFAVKRF